MRIETRIKQVIVRVLSLDIDPDEIADDDLLFDGGLGLNSMATIQIIVGIEEEFGIQVPDEDLRVELFESVRAMADYVRSAVEHLQANCLVRPVGPSARRSTGA